MNQPINDGGPAYPCTEANGCNSGCPGMSLRDHFAGEALSGIEASQGNSDNFISTPEKVAARAYLLADAMLKARESNTNG